MSRGRVALMVAEKPSVAKGIVDHLSRGKNVHKVSYSIFVTIAYRLSANRNTTQYSSFRTNSWTWTTPCALRQSSGTWWALDILISAKTGSRLIWKSFTLCNCWRSRSSHRRKLCRIWRSIVRISTIWWYGQTVIGKEKLLRSMWLTYAGNQSPISTFFAPNSQQSPTLT